MKPVAFSACCAFALSACAVLTSIPTPTGDWLPIGDNQEGNIVSIDTASLFKSETRATTWVRIDYRKPPNSSVNATEFYVLLNCKKNLFQIHKQVELDAQGQALDKESVKTTLKKVTPGSTESLVFRRVCV